MKFSKFFKRLKDNKRPIFYVLIFIVCLIYLEVNTDFKELSFESIPFRHGLIRTLTYIDFSEQTKMPINQVSAQRGQILYIKLCVKCHGKRGRGDGPIIELIEKRPKNLTILAQRVKYLQYYMIQTSEEGKGRKWIPYFTKVNLVDVEHYIRTFKNMEEE
jgi:cytochrome c553